MLPLSSRGGGGLSGRATKKYFFCGFPKHDQTLSDIYVENLHLNESYGEILKTEVNHLEKPFLKSENTSLR